MEVRSTPMEKRIQIPLSLYETMIDYIQDHYDPLDQKRYMFIINGVKNKHDAEIRRNLYAAYKSQTDKNTREILRQAYLNAAGVPSHGRWNEQVEENYHNGNFDLS